jgi:dihydrodipicolinate synthase/N-acetylneuraminate lyase
MGAVLLAAAVTPLRDDGHALDEDAIGPLVQYLQAGGCDGVLCCGSVGEGILLTPAERRRAAVLFRAACAGPLIVHAGCQTTADTCALAAHAAETGADGVAVIPPPYFPLSDDELTEHFVQAARACAPTPFYLYAFTARSGYPLPVRVAARVAEHADNLVGMKVSESSFDQVKPYLGLGLDVYVGSDPVIPEAFAAGAAGAASGLASAFPERIAALVSDPTAERADDIRKLRNELVARGEMIAVLKDELGRRGVPVRRDVRAPLLPLPAQP